MASYAHSTVFPPIGMTTPTKGSAVTQFYRLKTTIMGLSHGYVKLTEFLNELFKLGRIMLLELLLELSLELLL